MKIINLSNFSDESQVLSLDDLKLFDKKAFAGEDSVVYRNLQTNQALHLYNSSFKLDEIILYSNCLNLVEKFLRENPYEFKALIDNEEFIGEVYAIPVFEVGMKYFKQNENLNLRIYSLSDFIQANSLCWPGRAQSSDEQKLVQNFPIIFYDKLENYLYKNLPQIGGIDINPVNVKYRIDKNNKNIILTITDIAKRIRNINRS